MNAPEHDRHEASGDQPGAAEALSPPYEAKRTPADYYAAPPSPARFPRWVPISCGGAAIVTIIAMFAIGSFLASGGLSSFVAIAIGQFQGEMKAMLDDDVDAASRDELDAALRDVRERLRARTIDQREVLPLLEEIRKVGKDRKISASEVENLIAVVRRISASEEPAQTD